MSSRTNGPIIDPGLCRCCRSIKKCRIITSEYNWMNQKEVYSDMIMDCFGILLSHMDDGDERDRGVCATCVVRLRDALAFRKQVLQCEEMFLQSRLEYKEGDTDMENLKDIGKKLECMLKPEPKAEAPPEPYHDDVGGDLDFSDDDRKSEPEIKSPKAESPPPSDDDLPLILRASKLKTSNGKLKKGKVKKTTLKRKKLKMTEKRDTSERDLEYMSEENLLTIIEYSYVCPFKNRRNNYYCYYCKDYFPKPEDLREHTSTHDTKPFRILTGFKKMVKLDITRIDCRLCTARIDNLAAFKTHIDQDHGKKIYFEAPDRMLLFKLTWNNLVCVICNDVFEDFNGLNSHMVEHFSNFTCDVCGMCFLEKSRLDAHLRRHKDDERHTCEVCGKVFKSNHYKDMHVDIVHKKIAIIRCPKCDECFMSYALKNKHLTEAHGQKRVYPCNMCDKVYNRQKTLTEHQRRNHQKVLKHQCEYCEQRFYLPSRLKEHISTHTGERNFRCEYCEKSYPRLKSLQYHIRTHTNDRRYRCHICGQAFIQNPSLKAHIKNHHPECDVEGCFF